MYKIKYQKRYRMIEKYIILGDANTSLERKSLHQTNSRILSIRSQHFRSNGSQISYLMIAKLFRLQFFVGFKLILVLLSTSQRKNNKAI